MALAADFRTHAPSGLAKDVGAAELESVLSWLVERGRVRWPDLPLPPGELAGAIGERGLSLADLRTLHAEDLHLAVACARGVAGALAAFNAEHLTGSAFGAALKRIDPSPAFVDEVRQVARERLFVPPPGRITEYTGRGSLASWTRIIVVRIALRLRPRRTESVSQLRGERAAEIDPELRMLQHKYGRQFEAAIAAAFAVLDDEQHNLLRLQLVDGLATGQIASLFRVDRSTIKRRLAACRELLLEQTKRSLRENLWLSTESFESLARLLVSQLDVSMARLLRAR